MKFVEKKGYNFIFYSLALVIFFSFVGFSLSGQEGLLRLLKLKRLKGELQQTTRGLLTQNLALHQELNGLNQLQNIEYIARQSLGVVYPDEVVYVMK